MLGDVVDDVRLNKRLILPAAEPGWRFSRFIGPAGRLPARGTTCRMC